MAFFVDNAVNVPGSSMSRKQKFISKCARPALFFMFLYVLLLIALLACDKETEVFPPRIFGHAGAGKTYPPLSNLTAYEEWQKLQRECLLGSSCKDPPLLIWQCPENKASKSLDVSDRIQGIQFSMLLAIATQRLFLIQQQQLSKLDDSFVPATFNWTVPPSVSAVSPLLDWFSCGKNLPCQHGGIPSVRRLPAPYDNEPDLNLEEDNLMVRLDQYPVLRIWTRFSPGLLKNLKSNPHLASHLSMFMHMDVDEVQRMLLASLFKPSEDLKRIAMGSLKIDGKGVYHNEQGTAESNVVEGRASRFKNGSSKLNEAVGAVSVG